MRFQYFIPPMAMLICAAAFSGFAPNSAQAGFLASVDAQAAVGRFGGLPRLNRDVDGGSDSVSANAFASIVDSTGGIFGTRGTGAAIAEGRASLATGELGVRGEAEGNGTASVDAHFMDTLSFDAPTLDTRGVDEFDIGIGFGASGTLTGGFVGNSGNLFDARAFTTGVVDGFSVTEGLQNGTTFHGDTITVTRLRGEFRDLNIEMRLRVAGFEGIGDFSNTATVSLDVPQGVTFTSDSGVFLSEQQTVVPEPSSLALLGIGAMSLVGYGWRRNRRRTQAIHKKTQNLEEQP